MKGDLVLQLPRAQCWVWVPSTLHRLQPGAGGEGQLSDFTPPHKSLGANEMDESWP